MAVPQTGRVKFFSDQKGYGFIAPDEGGDDVFMHRSGFSPGLTMLSSGDKVSYDLVDSAKKKGNGKSAANVRAV